MYETTRLIEALLLPPGLNLLLWLIGITLLRILPGLGRFIMGLAVSLLWFFATPWFSFTLLDVLQTRYPPLTEVPADADVIVVLGAGRYQSGREFGEMEMLSRFALERMRYAGYLAKRHHLPVITSGGTFPGDEVPESTLGRRFLEGELGLHGVIEEGQSQTTFENARFVREILDARGLRRPLLVTHYWHMPRAMESFRHFDIVAYAAPTARYTEDRPPRALWRWMPQAENLHLSQLALHEIVGRAWYRFRLFRSPSPAPAGAAVAP